MVGVVEILRKMEENPKGVRFRDFQKVCEHFFGPPRQSGGSHCIFRTPWQGDPRINIQDHRGWAKPYQVRQVLAAVEKLRVKHGS